jgi:hypothetical protein
MTKYIEVDSDDLVRVVRLGRQLQAMLAADQALVLDPDDDEALERLEQLTQSAAKASEMVSLG